jgi:hypothetical protein
MNTQKMQSGDGTNPKRALIAGIVFTVAYTVFLNLLYGGNAILHLYGIN